MPDCAETGRWLNDLAAPDPSVYRRRVERLMLRVKDVFVWSQPPPERALVRPHRQVARTRVCRAPPARRTDGPGFRHHTDGGRQVSNGFCLRTENH
jgi:hypothetical protein